MKYSEMTAVDFLLLAFVIGAWLVGAVSSFRAWRHRRPGTLLLLRENISEAGQADYRRLRLAILFGVGTVVLLVLRSATKS